jgi:hypothetical protein
MSEVTPKIEQNINLLNLSFRAGDDFLFEIVSPFSLTGSTIEATIGSLDFTVATVDQYTRTLSLTEVQTATLAGGETWRLRITISDYTRTHFEGVYIPL